MHLFVGRGLGQPSIVPIIIAKHMAKYPAGTDYSNINFGGSFRIASFADRKFELATGLNVSKSTYICYDMHNSLPSSESYNSKYFYYEDFYYHQPRNVKMKFNKFFVPLQFNYNFSGYKKFYHQVGIEYQLGFRYFSFLIENESGNYTDNFGSLNRREDLNLLLIGKTTASNYMEADPSDFGVSYSVEQDDFNRRNQTPTLFNKTRIIHSFALHYKFTYKDERSF